MDDTGEKSKPQPTPHEKPCNEHGEGIQTAFPIAPIDIRDGDRIPMLQHIAQALDEGYQPDINTFKALVLREINMVDHTEVIFEDYIDPENMGGSNPEISSQLYNVNDFHIIPPNETRVFPGGLSSLLDLSEILLTTVEVFKRLPPETKAEMIIWMLETNNATGGQMDLEIFDLLGPLFGDIDDSEYKDSNYIIIFNYIYDHIDEYRQGCERSYYHFGDTPTGDLVQEIEIFRKAQTFYTISQFSNEKQLALLSILVTAPNKSYVTLLNEIRLLIEQEDMAPEKKSRLERTGKLLLGLEPDDPRPFHTSLESTYRQFAFESYDANIAAQQYDEDLLKAEISKLGGSDLTIVDVASGTGRMIPILGRIDNAKRVIEVDFSEENIEKARKYAQEKGFSNIEFRNKSWDQMGIEPESVDFAFCIGRSLTLAETEDNFYEALGGIAKTIKLGGTFIFDLPDPNSGNILLYRQKHAQFLEKLRVPIGWSVDKNGRLLPDVDIVIDGPNEESLYNRYVPQIDKVVEFLSSAGFDTEIIDEQPISGSNYSEDDRNIYIRTVKKH